LTPCLLALASAGPLAAADDENPIVASIRSRLKDPDRPFVLLVSLRTKEGMGKKLESAFAKAAPETRKEKGCLAYDLHRDAAKAEHYLVYERWKSLADLSAHLQTDYIKALLAEVHELTEGMPDLQVFVPAGD
jgi:quinol monooxygenase YgiN